jgi:hypothetical protein
MVTMRDRDVGTNFVHCSLGLGSVAASQQDPRPAVRKDRGQRQAYARIGSGDEHRFANEWPDIGLPPATSHSGLSSNRAFPATR